MNAEKTDSSVSQVKPGQQVEVKVIKTPTSVAATKTLQRLLLSDPQRQVEQRGAKLRRARHTRPKQRGGRKWYVRPRKINLVEGRIGETGQIYVTPQTLKDLKSVERFIEVQ